MLLVCPKRRRSLPAEPAGPPDATLRFTGIHRDSSSFLDRYAGELLLAKMRPESEDVPAEQTASEVRSIGAIFHPGLSTGRDTLAAALVILGIIAFEKGQPERASQDSEAFCRLGFRKACQILKRHRWETQS